MFDDVLTVVLAGGKGTRLDPLTRDRAKPAVPFAGGYRIIDFTLSNCVNSGLRRVLVLTQFKSRSLDRHLHRAWHFLSSELGDSIEVVPPQQRIDETWYKGTADALYQNIYSMEKARPQAIVVLAGDHVYSMDYGKMVQAHWDRDADLTVGAVEVPLADVAQFGVMTTDAIRKITRFREKPATADPLPDAPGYALGSMGIYVFTARTLFDQLCDDAARPGSTHDFGHDIIPGMIAGGRAVYAHRLMAKTGRPYWRDVGTLDALYQANMDLLAESPLLDLADPCWPVRTLQRQLPPAQFVTASGHPGQAHDSLVAAGCVVHGGTVRRSVLSPGVRVSPGADVTESVLFDGVTVGRNCRVHRAIIDKNVTLPPGTTVGLDPAADRRRGFAVTAGGVVVVPKSEPGESVG